MTSIVGIAHEGVVYIGGERGISDNDVILSMSRPKIGVRGDWIYGYAGDLGIGQLMHVIDLPIVEDKDDPYLLIMNELIYTLHERIDKFINNDEPQADFLIGCKGRLFELDTSAWGIAEVQETAIGSGSQFCLGSLYSSIDKDPIDRIGLALGASITYSTTCQGPIDILYL